MTILIKFFYRYHCVLIMCVCFFFLGEEGEEAQVYAQRDGTRTGGTNLRTEGGFPKIIDSAHLNIFITVTIKA